MEAYDKARATNYEQNKAAIDSEATLCTQHARALRRLKSAVRAAAKAKAQASSEKRRKLAAKKQDTQAQRLEQRSHWPDEVYRIIINLDTAIMTPQSSRRGSVSSDTTITAPQNTFHESSKRPLALDSINLSISYITYSASWCPRYDLNLNTLMSTGALDYGAELRNTTSETWRDAKIILSTSQTTFSGLSEEIPTLHPWHLHLQKGSHHGESQALMSGAELAARNSVSTHSQPTKSRGEVVARSMQNVRCRKPSAPTVNVMSAVRTSSSAVPPGSQIMGKGHVRASFGAARHSQTMQAEAMSDDGFGALDDPEPILAFEKGDWDESGMTITYELPGQRTLAPRENSIKHKIARVDFKNVIFSHIVIGKLRQVAFLKARLMNTSKIALLQGPLGLTLDGSFLGRTLFPRCSPGQSISLSLGVDPSITVSYPRPVVHRSQSGLFTKETANVFTRTCTIRNTRPNKVAEITVLDQVPVSEDERLGIEITQPQGLKVGGHSTVKAGMNVEGETGKWGRATAEAKKTGEITWKVFLEGKQAVRLNLQYATTCPSGEDVVGF